METIDDVAGFHSMAKLDAHNAQRIISAFVNDPAAEDRFNDAALERLVGPLFTSPLAAPASCSFHPNPGNMCYERLGAQSRWSATRCLCVRRQFPVTTQATDVQLPDLVLDDGDSPVDQNGKDSTDNRSSVACAVKGGGANVPSAPIAAIHSEDNGWASFCDVTRQSMRHPNFRLLWRHGSSRKGTLLKGVNVDAPLATPDDTFVVTVHRACIVALADAAVDPALGAVVFAAAREIASRLDRMRAFEACDAVPCANSRLWSTDRLAAENSVLLAFFDALYRWRSRDHEQQNQTIDHNHHNNDEPDAHCAASWASDAASAQEAVDLFLAHEEALCKERARVLMAPRGASRLLYVICQGQSFTWYGDAADDTRPFLHQQKSGRQRLATWVDEPHVERALTEAIREGGPALYNIALCFGDTDRRSLVLDNAALIVSSPLAFVVERVSLAWAVGPNLLATDMALHALESVLAGRSGYAARIPNEMAMLAVARRAMDALYADERIRTAVLNKTVADRIDALWAQRGVAFPRDD